MKRIVIALLLLTALIAITACETHAQTPAQKPAAAQPTAEQKARLAELAKAWEAKAKEADAARDKYLIQLMATLAELGLKPSETSVTWNDKGEPVFNRVEPTPATAKTPEAKPEAKP